MPSDRQDAHQSKEVLGYANGYYGYQSIWYHFYSYFNNPPLQEHLETQITL